MQIHGISLVVMERETDAALTFLEKFFRRRYSAAIINALETAKKLVISSTSVEIRHRRINDCLIMKIKIKVVMFLGRRNSRPTFFSR